MEIKSYSETTERFVCPYCKSVYNSKEAAKECAKLYELAQYIKLAEPFHWYQIQTTRFYLGDGSKHWVFPKKISVTARYGSENMKSCHDFDYSIQKFGRSYGGFGDYGEPISKEMAFFFPDTKLTVKEAYEQYGLIPGDKDKMDSNDWNLVPDDILNDINEIVKTERRNLFEYLEKLEKDELIDCLVQYTDPFTKYKLHLKNVEPAEIKTNNNDFMDALLSHINGGNGEVPNFAQEILGK